MSIFSTVLATPLWSRSKIVFKKNPIEKVSVLPEESFRNVWDRGCSDWQDLLSEMSSKDTLALKFERKDGQYYLWGQARIKPELGETPEHLIESLNLILDESKDYQEWIYSGINEHPQKGSSYFVTLSDLKVRNETPFHVYLSGPFVFHLVSLKLGGISTIELLWDPNSKLECVQTPLKTQLTSAGAIRRFRMFPRKDVLEWLIGELTIFPRENQRGERVVDIQTRVVMRVSPLLFSLLPSKLIENELKYRAQRVFQNVIEIRRKKVWASAANQGVLYPEAKEVGNRDSAPSKSPSR